MRCLLATTFLLLFALHIEGFCIRPFSKRFGAGADVRRRATSADFEPTPFNGKGTVLLAKPGEYDHYMSKAAILIYASDPATGTSGLILNKPSAFPLGDMAPGVGPFSSNTLYMGGNDGGDTAIMVHCFDFGGAAKYIGNGIHIGGMKLALAMVEEFKASPKDFRFVFNNVHWAPGIVEKEIENGRWDVCRVSAELVVKEDDLWSRAQSTVRHWRK